MNGVGAMRVSIEWFLFDNALMDFVVLAFAAALSGLRLRMGAAVLLSFLGAGFALAALWVCPILLTPVPKLLFAAVLALGLRAEGWRAYLRALLSVLLCAFLLGGLMMLLSLQMPGSGAAGMAGGALIGTVASRAVLVALLAAALLPRLLRTLRSAARADSLRVGLRILLDGRLLELTALIDTGNMLSEPLTGLPVVLVDRDIGEKAGYPVRYAGVGGGGELLARRAQAAQVRIGGAWREIDIMVARSPAPITGAQAIIGSNALPPPANRGAMEKGEFHGA